MCVSTFGGSAYGDGGLALQASLAGPVDVSYWPDGTATGSLLVADSVANSHAVRLVNLTTGVVSIFAGGHVLNFGFSGFLDNRLATAALLNAPSSATLTPDGATLLIADTANNRVRSVDLATRMITTIAGDGTPASLSAQVATSGRVNAPRAVLAHPSNPADVYISEATGNIISLRLGNGSLIRWAGTGAGTSTGDGGVASAATMANPQQMAWGAAGQLYVAEHGGHRVRVIYANRSIDTYACTGTPGSSGDYGATTLLTAFSPAISLLTLPCAYGVARSQVRRRRRRATRSTVSPCTR